MRIDNLFADGKTETMAFVACGLKTAFAKRVEDMCHLACFDTRTVVYYLEPAFTVTIARSDQNL